MQQFDYIFAGFGLSGMTLFYELSKDPDFRNKTVLIVDRDAKNQNDRTWSFWADAAIDFQHLVKKQWKRGDFYTMQGEHLPMDFGNFTYNTSEGADFYAFMNQYFEGLSPIEATGKGRKHTRELPTTREQCRHHGLRAEDSHLCRLRGCQRGLSPSQVV
jgi:hypothetical protein